MSIFSLLNQIKNDEIVLPAIQRDFVWPNERIYKLLDSLMRGYPIGIILLWETYQDIQYRTFVMDYKPGNLHSYHDNTQGKKLKIVLDGQQRLQSLFIALYGTLDGTSLYFDVLSGRESDDVSEEKFVFIFSTPDEVEKWNTHVKDEMAKSPDKKGNNVDNSHFVKVSDLFAKGARERKDLVKELSETLGLPDQDQLRLDLNLSRLVEALSKDQDLLRISTIDEDLPSDSLYRKSDADVLEVFVRVNTEGTPLSRSDLIFSMLKLNWKESATVLPEFVQSINEGNSFGINTDFVIRCLFAVSDLGTKFDINLLRKKSNATKLRTNFEKCCNAIRATVDFVQTHCWCASSRVIGGSSTMVPFVYYLFHTKNHEIRNDQIVNARKALYLFGFSRPFSRYADSRLGAFIRDELRPLAKKDDETFPLESAIWWVGYWERIKAFDKELLQANPVLTLHLVQGLTGAKVQYVRNAPEVDHIFPRSELRRRGYDEAIINDFANFWILAKGKNQNKSNQHPSVYFEDVDDKVLKEALIDREFLDYRRYTTFISQRSEHMLQKVKEKLQFCDDDFQIDAAGDG
jgi:hypothetical protein